MCGDQNRRDFSHDGHYFSTVSRFCDQHPCLYFILIIISFPSWPCYSSLNANGEATGVTKVSCSILDMGCGASQDVYGSSDLEKSESFQRLVSKDNNALAAQLNKYFQDLVSECQYRSQGNTAGYERMLRNRKTEVVVNRSVRQAEKGGIGGRPLTFEGARTIVELFLGHVMLNMERKQWVGQFNYSFRRLPTDSVGSPIGSPLAVGDSSNPRVTVDDGVNCTSATDQKSHVRLDIEGSIEFPSLGGAERFTCLSDIAFDFFVCLEEP